MKSLFVIAFLSLSLGVRSAYALAHFARGELTLQTTASATYDSRVTVSSLADDDYIFSFGPLFTFRREAGVVRLQANAGATVNRFAEMSRYNSEDYRADLRLSIPASEYGRLSGSADLGYVSRGLEPDEFLNDRIGGDEAFLHFNGLYLTGAKTSLSANGSYRQIWRDQYSDQELFNAGLSFSYNDFLYRTQAGVTYAYQSTESSGNNLFGVPLNQEANTFSVFLARPLYGQTTGRISYGYRFFSRSAAETPSGERSSDGAVLTASIDGPFLPERYFPKLTSSLSVSYQQSEVPGINDRGGRSLRGSMLLSWEARERTRIHARIARTLELTANDTSVERTTYSLGALQNIGHTWSAHGSVSFEQLGFRGLERRDDVFRVDGNLNYRFRPSWSAGWGYRYTRSESNRAIANYERHVVNLSLLCTF